MLSVGLVLFVLSRYHSPQLAGATAFFSLFPGLVVSPLAGALLDRYGRVRLVTVDYIAAAVILITLSGLSAAHALPPTVLLALCGVASLTRPLSGAGGRSIFPTLTPRDLWERANALDSTSGVVASVLGAPLAGMLIGFVGGEWELAATALVYACAAVAMVTVHDPSPWQMGDSVLKDAWSGVVYVLRNRSLVGLALTFLPYNIGWGGILIAGPVLVLGPFHQGPAAVGYLWGAYALAAVAGGLLSGRISSSGRERQLMSVSLAAVAAFMVLFPFAGSIIVVAAALVAIGIVEGPFNIAFVTLRQRRTDPAMFGRVFAVSMSLNMIGTPIGSALAGFVIPRSLNLELWLAAGAVFVAAAMALIAIPAKDAGLAVSARSGR